MLVNSVILGVFSSLIGYIAPGLLNVTASRISAEDSKKKALLFSGSVCFVVLLQAIFAYYLVAVSQKFPSVIELIQKVSIVIFLILSIFFFRKAYQEKKNKAKPYKTIKKPIVSGFLLAMSNMFAVPFFYGLLVTFKMNHWLISSSASLILYVLGVGIGVCSIFYIYVLLAQKIKAKIVKFSKYLNLVLGVITGGIAILSFVKLM